MMLTVSILLLLVAARLGGCVDAHPKGSFVLLHNDDRPFSVFYDIVDAPPSDLESESLDTPPFLHSTVHHQRYIVNEHNPFFRYHPLVPLTNGAATYYGTQQPNTPIPLNEKPPVPLHYIHEKRSDEHPLFAEQRRIMGIDDANRPKLVQAEDVNHPQYPTVAPTKFPFQGSKFCRKPYCEVE